MREKRVYCFYKHVFITKMCFYKHIFKQKHFYRLSPISRRDEFCIIRFRVKGIKVTTDSLAVLQRY